MKPFLSWLPTLAASHLLLSCATTGDPYEDSLFFSTKRADERHDGMKRDLHRIEHDTEEARISAISQKGTLARLNKDNRGREREIADIKAKTRALNQEKVRLDGEIEEARRDGRNDADLIQQRSAIESEVDGLNRTLQKLIQIQ